MFISAPGTFPPTLSFPFFPSILGSFNPKSFFKSILFPSILILGFSIFKFGVFILMFIPFPLSSGAFMSVFILLL